MTLRRTRRRKGRIQFTPAADRYDGDYFEVVHPASLVRGRDNAQCRWENRHHVEDWLDQYPMVCLGCNSAQELFVVEARYRRDQKRLAFAIADALQAAHCCPSGKSRMFIVSSREYACTLYGLLSREERELHEYFDGLVRDGSLEPWFLFDRARYRLERRPEAFEREFVRGLKRDMREIQERHRDDPPRPTRLPDAETQERVWRALAWTPPDRLG